VDVGGSATARVLVFQKEAVKRRVISAGRVVATPEGDPLAMRLDEARRTHKSATARLRKAFEDLSVSADYVYLSDRVDATGYDLVVALGGDGTVLHASHQIGATPVLGINSAPGHSVGFLTATTIDRAAEVVERALAGRLAVTTLQRMAVDIDGRRVYGRVLNDVLFSHECPASTARYILRLGEIEEEQMSSGIWAGPAAGSTAAVRASGGRVLPPRSRKLQFVVREPYRRNGTTYRLTRGLVPPGQRLVIRNVTDAARMYVDGPHVVLPVQLGETVELGLSDEPLHLLGFSRP
jgi:NAD+ kinase